MKHGWPIQGSAERPEKPLLGPFQPKALWATGGARSGIAMRNQVFQLIQKHIR
jgi:hypothetical protein